MGSKPKSVRPYGSRSCSHQQFSSSPVPENFWESHPDYSEEQFGSVMLALEGKIPSRVRSKAFADFYDLLEKAEAGKATFGRRSQYDVDRLNCVVDVLELKWKSLPPRADDLPYVGLRLYYTEPKQKPGMLLKLKLVCKIPGRAAQDEDAKEAQERFDNWLKGEMK